MQQSRRYRVGKRVEEFGGLYCTTFEEAHVGQEIENYARNVRENLPVFKCTDEEQGHPLYPVFMAAIEQAMHGKGTRHGGNVTPFLDQPWRHYAKLHGRGFLTGQAAKKLEEAASGKDGEAFIQECLGAITYIGMAMLVEDTDGR
jgi:hypothetical protein